MVRCNSDGEMCLSATTVLKMPQLFPCLNRKMALNACRPHSLVMLVGSNDPSLVPSHVSSLPMICRACTLQMYSVLGCGMAGTLPRDHGSAAACSSGSR